MSVPHCEVAGAGEAVLFLHGIGGDRSSWRRQLDRLRTRFRAVAWDMPGYGESPPLAAPSMTGYAEAAVALLDSLDCQRAHVVGHSLGGMIAQEMAVRAPERLASLTLYATSAAFGKPDGDWQRDFLAARLAPLDRGQVPADFAASVVGAMIGDDPHPDAVPAAIASMSRVSADAYRGALHSLLGFDRRAALAKIAAPTLLIAGEKDQTAPARVMEKMAAAIPDSRMVCLPGAGHLAHLERPEAFDAALEDFLAAVTIGEETA